MIVGKVLQFIRGALVKDAHVPDVKADLGGGDTANGQHFGPVGDDSHPLPQDFVAMQPGPESGTKVAVAYADTRTEKQAQPGEVRRYARNPSTGVPVAVIWLRSDGTIEIAGLTGGTVTINGVTIDGNGNVTAPGEVTANGDSSTPINLSSHTHPSPMGPTGEPLPG